MEENIEETPQIFRKRNWKKSYLVSVGSFYLFQGLYATAINLYKDNFLVNIANVDVSFFGIFTFLYAIPLYLKMFPGLLSDRVPIGRFGRRKPYILIGTLLYIPCFLILMFSKQTDVTWPWFFSLLGVQWVWVLVDGTLDALTVDITPENKKGIMQGVAWGSRGIGGVIASIILMILASVLGWQVTIALIGLFAVIQAFSGLFLKEPPIRRENLPPLKKVFKQTFFNRQVLFGFIFSLIASVTTASFLFFVPVFSGIGGVVGLNLGLIYAVGMAGSFLGAVVFGKISDNIGAKKTFIITAISFWIGVALWIPIRPGISLIYLFIIALIYGINIGGFMASSNRIAMELSDVVFMKNGEPGIEGFMFSTFSAVQNFGTQGLGPLIVSAVSIYLNLPYAFFVLIPFTLVAILLLKFVKPWIPKQ
ncbi:MAG: MFS transporter [Candidatus Lokiarchaeota archaeon]|nr:MFS transporter [Candidatus Lokiarchaeota archaeon]